MSSGLTLVSGNVVCSLRRCVVSFCVVACAGDKAKKAAGALKKGSGRKASRVHTKVHFFRPKTLKLDRKPKITASVASAKSDASKSYDIIKYPLTSESATKQIEENNTLVFIVGLTANKKQIKDAVKKLYDITAQKVNTLIRYASFLFAAASWWRWTLGGGGGGGYFLL